ncbi:DUF5944 family protein [Actinomyces lilanjuaniae]|uniref:DUF5944 family protein n=1 Tax=Actinomyces lilanjuaniae TaxID=2321394 RepID=UPI0013C4AACE|nr:DUF5944 family protein [Actinomyces lilanjuaniae]
MSPSFRLHNTMDTITSNDFSHTCSIASAAQKHILSQIVSEHYPVSCQVEASTIEGGICLQFMSQFSRLREEQVITHKFFFIERKEVREIIHHVSPDNLRATTVLLVPFYENYNKDYFNVSVCDREGYILTTDAFVFDREGRIGPYSFRQDFVSPIPVLDAYLREEKNYDGNRVARFCVSFEELCSTTPIHILWETIGTTSCRTVLCSPDTPIVTADLPLSGGSAAVNCDWVVIAVDDEERFIAQTSFSLLPELDDGVC